ncbi:MAG: hypothetical protein LC101_04210 [Flavobacteriales bacterium]|nr:hypothetical protein [Flavobacteriales bacterium]
MYSVKYGDADKFIAGIIAILGIGMVASPSGIMAVSFSEKIRKGRQFYTQKSYCPHYDNHLD